MDYKNRKWYEYILFVLLYGVLLFGAFMYVAAYVFVMSMTTPANNFQHIMSEVLFVAMFAVPIYILDILICLLRKKRDFSLKKYRIHFIKVIIPVILMLVVLFLYEIYMFVTGTAPLNEGMTYF